VQARAEYQRAGARGLGVQGGGGQIQCDVIGETCTHSGRLLDISRRLADVKVYVSFLLIVYKVCFALSHMRARFSPWKMLEDLVFRVIGNKQLNLKRYKLTD
jgi:hypothetical protein